MAENQIVKYMTDTGEVELSSQIVRQYLVNGNGNVTDQELIMFLNLCKYQKLNPFLREAYLIKFGTAPATIVTGKEVFTKRAAKLEKFDGKEEGITVLTSSGEIVQRKGSLVLNGEQLVGGWARIYRKDWSHPTEIEVSVDEYCRKNSDGLPMASWKSMPATMIRKVALVQALRETFPEDFQGLYSPEEMPIDDSKLNREPINITPEKEPLKPTTSKSGNGNGTGQAQALVAVMMKAGATKDDISLVLSQKVQDQSHITKDELDYLTSIFTGGTWQQVVKELKELAEIEA
jgi:phage recombination protein Bet